MKIKSSPAPYGFSWGRTAQAESIIQANLNKAKEEYARKSLDLRERAGRQLKHMRTEANLSRATMASLTGICSKKASSGIFVIIEEPTDKKSYGIDRLIEIAKLYIAAIELSKTMEPVRRGRKPKSK